MIPTERQLQRGNFKLIDGIWNKICTGPAHEEPTFLPATDKYFHSRKSGDRESQLLSRCRLCQNWSKLKSPGSEHGWIEVNKVHHYYAEAANRVGLAELSRRTGIKSDALSAVLTRKTRHVQKAKFKKVMLELISMRRKNEYSIKPGSRWRMMRRANPHAKLCSGCGGSLNNFTEGCQVCNMRKAARKERQSALLS